MRPRYAGPHLLSGGLKQGGKREAGSGKGMGKRIVGERPPSPVPLPSSRFPLPESQRRDSDFRRIGAVHWLASYYPSSSGSTSDRSFPEGIVKNGNKIMRQRLHPRRRADSFGGRGQQRLRTGADLARHCAGRHG